MHLLEKIAIELSLWVLVSIKLESEDTLLSATLEHVASTMEHGTRSLNRY